MKLFSIILGLVLPFIGMSQNVFKGTATFQMVTDHQYNMTFNGGKYDSLYVSESVRSDIQNLKTQENIEVRLNDKYTEIIGVRSFNPDSVLEGSFGEMVWCVLKFFFWAALVMAILSMLTGINFFGESPPWPRM